MYAIRSYHVEDKETMKKLCYIIEKLLETKYIIDDSILYDMFMEDISIQIESTLKRYMAFQIIK